MGFSLVFLIRSNFYRTPIKINKGAVVQVVLQRMWFDTTNSYKNSCNINVKINTMEFSDNRTWYEKYV